MLLIKHVVILSLTFAFTFISAEEILISGLKHEGEPLFLTPLIHDGQIEEAKTLSRVHGLAEDIELESYSGLITVNEEFQSNIFFWHFPARNNAQEAPVILWVDGGPGVSAFVSLFNQHGPLQVGLDGKLSLRETTWAVNHSMIYIEVPIGTGYSFTQDEAGYSNTSQQVAENVYRFLEQFFVLFPGLLPNEFYVGGISYGGHIVPPLAKLIIQKNQESSSIKINLRNILLFCPWSDPLSLTNYGPYLHGVGLIDEKTLNHFNEEHVAIAELISAEDYPGAKKRLELLFQSPTSAFSNATGFEAAFSVLQDKLNLEVYGFVNLVQTPEFRNAIHVGNLSYDLVSTTVQTSLTQDFMTSVKPDIEAILEAGFPVFIIVGQLDISVTHLGLTTMISQLSWKGETEYKVSQRNIWKIGSAVAGYARSGGNLTFVIMRNAGHFLIGDQPEWSLELINRVSNQVPF